MKIKVDVNRLPKPYLEPTRSVRVGEIVPKSHVNVYLDAMPTEQKDVARKRGQENRQKNLNLYTEEQVETIIRMFNARCSDAEIANKLGRGREAIHAKIQSMIKKGVIQKTDRRRSYIHHKPESEIVRRNAYTKAQDNVIVSMRMHNKSFEEIGDNLGRSKDSVRKRYYRIIGRC